MGPAGWVIALSVAAAVAGCVGQVDLFHDEAAAPLEPSSPLADGMGGGAPMAPSGVDPIQSPPEAPPGGAAPPSLPAAMDPDPAEAPEVPDPDAAPESPEPEPEPVPPEPEADPTGGARVCPAPAAPGLLDFESTNDDASQATFGDFESELSGGTFVYPDAASSDSAEAPALGLSSDMSDGDWHISGVVAGPAGFGLFFDCEQLDASRFVGLAFRLQGDLPAPGTLTFVVDSAANEVSRSWLLGSGTASPGPSFGRCTPLETAFDGSCSSARITLPVESQGDELLVRFADLADGSPEPRLNPAEITSIHWALPLPSTGPGGDSVPYAVDLRLDDIRFVEAE